MSDCLKCIQTLEWTESTLHYHPS